MVTDVQVRVAGNPAIKVKTCTTTIIINVRGDMKKNQIHSGLGKYQLYSIVPIIKKKLEKSSRVTKSLNAPSN